MLKKMIHDFLLALNSTIKTIMYCMNLSREASQIYTVTRIIIECLSPLIPIALSYSGKLLIDIFVSDEALEKSINKMLLIFSIILFCLLLKVVMNSWKQYATNQHSELIQKYIVHQQIEHALDIELAYFDRPEYYDKLISSFRDSAAVAEEVWNFLGLLGSVVALSGTLLFAIKVNLFYALLLLMVTVPSTAIALFYTRKLYQLDLAQINEGRKTSLLRSISSDKRYAQDFRLFNSKEYILRKHKIIWEKLFNEKRSILKKRSFLLTILEILPVVTICGINVHLGVKVLLRHNTVGDYTFYTALLQQMWSGISEIGSSSMILYENRLKFDNLQAFFSYKRIIKDGNQLFDEQIREIWFDNVSFRYSDNDPLVLKNINLRVREKETIALVGLNGSGKSTLIKLVLRFYDPTEGRILINGTDIRNYQLDSLRTQFSVYFQNMLSFPFSIRENFMISDNSNLDPANGKEDSVIVDELSKKRITDAMNKAACIDILNSAKNGINHNITRLFDSEGLELSVGQYQKFALARAFFRRHQILILDEPTSNVDAESERIILKWLQEETHQQIILWVTHDLANINIADKIVLLEHGEIIEKGSHLELLNRNGKYAYLYHNQEEKMDTGGADNNLE